MESIAVTKPDMGVLPRHRLALSPFGALAQTFAEELLARAERAEGRWPYVPLELLEEAPPDAEPAPAPVYQVDLRLVLEALRREKGESEQRRAVERIVERVLTIRESRPAPQRKEKAGEGRERPSHTWNLNQNFYQLIRQDNRFLNGVRHPAVESGDVETPWQALPGDLGQQARALSRRLQRRREGETVLPPLSRGREEDGAAFQSRRLERMSPPEEVRLLEQTAEQEHPAGQADGALQEAARKAVERAADILRTAAVKPATSAEGSSGHREGHVSARRTEQQMPLTTARDIRTSGPAAATEEQDTAARDIRTSNAATVSAEQATAAAQKVVPAPGLASDAMRAREQPGAPRTMPGPAGEELAYRVEEGRGGGDTGEGQTARPNTPSRQTSGREAEQSIARRGQGREETSEPVVSDAPARQAERRTALTAARDIRTSGTAAASAEQDSAAAQKVVPAPGLTSDAMRAGEQPGAPHTMPVPAGEELAYRMEEEHGGEGPIEGRAARPGTPPRPETGREAEQSTARRGRGREEASVPAAPEAPVRQAERRTALTAARDIRTSGPAAVSAEQDTAAAQKRVPTPGLASDAMRAGEQTSAPHTMSVPVGEELAYRVEEEHGGKSPVEGRAARPGTPSRQMSGREAERGTAHAGQARSIPGTAARLSGIGASASGAPRLAEVGAAAQHPHWGETVSGRDIRILPALRTAESTPPAAGHSALAAEAALPGEGAELAHRAGLEMGAQPGGESRAPSGRQPVRAPGGVFRAPSGASAGRGAEPVELTYGPAAPAAEPAGAPKQPPAVHAAEESEYVQSLPDWARRFLRESGGQGGQSHIGTARDISALPRPAQGEETVRWTAPGYRPPAPITYREKNREAETRQAAAPRLSEWELQRAADKIYRIIEDRIRQERRRLGL